MKKEWKFVKHKKERRELNKKKKKSNPEHTRVYGCFLFSFSLFSKLGSFEVWTLEPLIVNLLELENLLEPLTRNVFNLKKKKGGCRAKLNVFILKKNER